MTDKLIEQIEADQENGTPGPWNMNGWGVYATALEGTEYNVNGIVCSVATGVKNTWEAVANENRITRVPKMEARILADAEAVQHLIKRLKALQTYFDLSDEELDDMTTNERADCLRQHRLITEALDAYHKTRKGTG